MIMPTGDQPAGQLLDLLILGGGPAGLAAGIYAGRGRLSCAVLDPLGGGGELNIIDTIENYPGLREPITGPDLAELMRKQMESFGVSTTYDQAETITAEEDRIVVKGGLGVYSAKILLLATGCSHRELGVPGEEKLKGRGVSYCATCDGAFFKGKHVAVVGGGDTAVKEALFLSRLVGRVTLVHRREHLRAEKIMQENLAAAPNVDYALSSTVEEVLGEREVFGLRLKNVNTGATQTLPLSGVFVFIGVRPNSELVRGLIELDEAGFVKADQRMRTSHPLIFAAGDVRSGSVHQVASAVGDGATAAIKIQELLDRYNPPKNGRA
jgi:thioredoxin reductase (NADPH)